MSMNPLMARLLTRRSAAVTRRSVLFAFGGVASLWVIGGCTKRPVGSEGPRADGSKTSFRAAGDGSAAAVGESSPQPTKEGNQLAMNDTTKETAVLAGGCFWGMEEILRGVDGVLDTEVGYAGGQTASPSYETVKQGTTGHAESVRIVFDPKLISFAEILEKWFFRMHDPTTTDRQGNDRGTQYRSAIFYQNDEQQRVAEAVIAKVNASGVWPSPIVTQVVAAGPFTPAEGYHQNYLQENPGGYTCHYMRQFD